MILNNFDDPSALFELTHPQENGNVFSVPYGSMLQTYYSFYADSANKRRRAAIGRIKSADDAAKEVAKAEKRVRKAFGKFPKDIPLETKSYGIDSKNGVDIEKVLIQTGKNIHATMLVYRRSGDVSVQPGILLVCGHSDAGKAAPHYQILADSLARMGMTAVVIDPLGQGERKLYPGLGFSSVREHNLTGKQLWLTGEFFGAYRAYDARRAVDYMFTRQDIDHSKIGVAGVSGGGTLSSYIFALDHRIAAAAPSCFITRYMSNFDNELPTDSEQIPPGAWSNGGEMIDLIISRAPSPCLVLSVENDYFDPRGCAESVDEAKKIYSLLGKEDNIGMFVGPGSHDLPRELREATCRFFAHHFLGTAEDVTVPEGKKYPVEELLVLGGKMTHQLPGEYTISQHIAKKAELLAAERKRKTPDIAAFLRKALQIEKPTEVPEYSSLRSTVAQESSSVFGVKTEPGAMAILMRCKEKQTYFHLEECDHAVLYVGNIDSELEMSQMSVKPGTVVYAVDVRGTGKSRSLTCDHNEDFFAIYDSDYFYDATGKLLNRPLAGGRVRDLLATLKLLKTKCKKISVYACGVGGLLACYACAIEPENFDELILTGVPESWQSCINGKDIRWPQSIMLPHTLKHFDLPELYAHLSKQTNLQIKSQTQQVF